jgi:hypothetical protein
MPPEQKILPKSSTRAFKCSWCWRIDSFFTANDLWVEGLWLCCDCDDRFYFLGQEMRIDFYGVGIWLLAGLGSVSQDRKISAGGFPV